MTQPNTVAGAARDQVISAAVLLAVGIQDPGPMVSPRCATAIGPLNTANQLLAQCAVLLDGRGRGDLAGEARSLADAAAARARELGVAVALTPWPFVYAPLGAILNAVITLRDQVTDFAQRVPLFLDPVEPISRTTASNMPNMPNTFAGTSPTWSPESFPWPDLKKVGQIGPAPSNGTRSKDE